MLFYRENRHSLMITLMIAMAVLMIFSCSVGTQARAIYTNNTKIDATAEKVIRRCTTDKMTSEQKLKAVYLYLVKNMHYSHSRGHVRIKVTAKDIKIMKEQRKLLRQKRNITYNSSFKRRYRNLLTMQGTCYDMSAVMCILANHLGYRAGLNSGEYVRRNGSTCEHWWNHVVIKGHKKYFDVQAANHNWKKHHSMKNALNYYCKGKGSRIWRKHHR